MTQRILFIAVSDEKPVCVTAATKSSLRWLHQQKESIHWPHQQKGYNNTRLMQTHVLAASEVPWSNRRAIKIVLMMKNSSNMHHGEWVSPFSLHRLSQAYITLDEKFSNYSHSYANLDGGKLRHIVPHRIIGIDGAHYDPVPSVGVNHTLPTPTITTIWRGQCLEGWGHPNEHLCVINWIFYD